MRLVEAMAITHFIVGGHKCLINEFMYTRAGPFERFLRWSRTNVSKLVAGHDDLQKAIEKMETKELMRGAEEVVHRHAPRPKLLRK